MRPRLRQLLGGALLCFLCLAPALLDAAPLPPWSWRFIAGGVTVGPVAFAPDGIVYYATGDRYLYAVDPGGTMIWRTDLGVRPAGGLVVGPDQTIYVTLENGGLVALNRDGRLIWQARVTAGRPFAPVVTQSGLVLTVREPATVEARTHTGRLIWGIDLETRVSTAPVLVPDGSLLVSGTGGELLLVSTDGRLLGRRYLGEVATVLGVTGQAILAGSADGRVIAVDAALEPLWRADVGSAIHTLLVGSRGDIFVISDDGMLSRITPQGILAWRVRPDSGSAVAAVAVVARPETSATPELRATAPADLLLVTGTGTLEAWSREAEPVWRVQLPDRPVSLGLSPAGEAVVPTGTWVTYAYPAGLTPGGAWPQARGDPARRGVAPGALEGRPDLTAYERSVDYLALRARLLAGGQTEQNVAMADVAARVRAGHDLAGRYPYLLQLSEHVAGSPYFGQLSQFGALSAPRRAREEAIYVLGEIGDLATARFLARLLSHETDATLQTSILASMGRLGTPIDRELAARLANIVRRNAREGPDNALGHAVVAFVESVHLHRGGYLHPDVAQALLTVAQANYSRQVREYALSTVRLLAGQR